MTEEEARDWIVRHHGQSALERLGVFVTMLVEESGRQNLIARSTIPSVWSRHIVDSAQLAGFSTNAGVWLDIGSGGGLPGVVLALLMDRSFILCEPRGLRATFLRKAIDTLGLADRVSVAVSKVEALTVHAGTVTARAVTGLDALLKAARHCADHDTSWILPLGRSGMAQIQASTMLRRAVFHVEPSLTDPTASILVVRGIA